MRRFGTHGLAQTNWLPAEPNLKDVLENYQNPIYALSPAIFRVHYETHCYKPHIHIDSVKYREQRTDYVVYRYEHQFAGVLCIQNADETGEGTHKRYCINVSGQKIFNPILQKRLLTSTQPKTI